MSVGGGKGEDGNTRLSVGVTSLLSDGGETIGCRNTRLPVRQEAAQISWSLLRDAWRQPGGGFHHTSLESDTCKQSKPT